MMYCRWSVWLKSYLYLHYIIGGLVTPHQWLWSDELVWSFYLHITSWFRPIRKHFYMKYRKSRMVTSFWCSVFMSLLAHSLFKHKGQNFCNIRWSYWSHNLIGQHNYHWKHSVILELWDPPMQCIIRGLT